MGLGNDCPFRIGFGQPGQMNLITDVPGVLVGHVTLDEGAYHSGVTAIIPGPGNLFTEKIPAACHVINGFGKSVGLMQLKEMGTLESPILLTNTFSVGTAATALLRRAMDENPEMGRDLPTLNPLVAECNDGYLSDIRQMRVSEEHVRTALDGAAASFQEGSFGAGRGMSCLGFKGGIGSASRQLEIDGALYTIGALSLCNFGRKGRLLLGGERLGEKLLPLQEACPAPESEADKGSIIMVLATDLPLSDRQLERLSVRAGAGLARTGSYYGNGSGDLAIAFSTAQRIPLGKEEVFLTLKQLRDDYIEEALELSAEAVEESIISALWHSESFSGRDGHFRPAFRQLYLSHLASCDTMDAPTLGNEETAADAADWKK